MKKFIAAAILVIGCAAGALAASIPQLGWPVDPATAAVSTGFGATYPNAVPRTRSLTGRNVVNVGVDLTVPAGSPVVAAEDGTVLAAVDALVLPTRVTHGFVVLLHRDASGALFTTLYSGLTSVDVTVGDVAVKGQALGGVLGTVVHFGVRASEPVPSVAAAAAPALTIYYGPYAAQLTKVRYPDGWVNPLLYLPAQ